MTYFVVGLVKEQNVLQESYLWKQELYSMGHCLIRESLKIQREAISNGKLKNICKKLSIPSSVIRKNHQMSIKVRLKMISLEK